jgi:hypothetical protein
MDVIEALVVIAVGAAIVLGPARELWWWYAGRSRRRRTTGVVVGTVEPGAAGPGTKARSAVFRFTTEDGRTVQSRSSSWSYPGPKTGTQVEIVYDTDRPERSAERAGIQRFKLIAAPAVMVIGAALIGFGISLLG